MFKSFFHKQTNVQDVPKEIELTVENAEVPTVQSQLQDFKAPSTIETTSWWKLVPKPFLLLIVLCMGFALLSLAVLALMALNTSQDNGQMGPINSTPLPVLNEPSNASTSIYLLWIGIFSSILGSLQTATGYCSQRLGHQLEESHKKNPLVFVGLLLLAGGTIAAVVNLGILGQSVTAPFAAMTLIFNGMLAYSVLKEKVTKVDVIATILVLVGVCIAVVGVGMAEIKVQKYVLADIERIFFRSWFPSIYSITLLSFLVGSYVIVMRNNLQNSSMGLCCFSIGAGLLSGFSSFFVKCSLEIAKSAAQNKTMSDLENPVTYLFALGIPICLISQLKFMGLGLKHFGTLKFVPPYHAFIIISNLVNGMIYFEESKSHTILSASLFVVGCIITIGGVLLLLAKVRHGSSTNKLEEATSGQFDDVKV